MAKKKQDDLDFEEFEDDSENLGEGEADEDYDDEEYDEDDEEEEEDEGKGGSIVPIILAAVVGIAAFAGGVVLWLNGFDFSAVTSKIPGLSKPSSALVVASSASKPSSQAASKFANKQLEQGPASATVATTRGASAGSTAKKAGVEPTPAQRTAPVAAAQAGSAVAAKPQGEHLAAKHEEAKATQPSPAPKAQESSSEASRAAKTAASKPVKHAGAAAKPKSATRTASLASPRTARAVRTSHRAKRHGRRAGSALASKGGRYTVQVGAFSLPANAQRLIASLKSEGLEAYGGGNSATGGSFTVQSNIVDTREKAEELASQFRQAGQRPRIESSADHQFVVSLGRFGTQEKATAIVTELNGKGLYASVGGQAARSSKGPNRVMVGHYSTWAEAEAAASRLRAKVGAAVVVKR